MENGLLEMNEWVPAGAGPRDSLVSSRVSTVELGTTPDPNQPVITLSHPIMDSVFLLTSSSRLILIVSVFSVEEKKEDA